MPTLSEQYFPKTVPRMKVKFRLNGIRRQREVPVNWTLLRLLRDDLGYFGTKCGCGIGECGACTVLLNRRAVNSCLVLAPQIDGSDIWTIEGLAEPGTAGLHPIQEAFIKCDAVHCGFCTPGMVMAALALLLECRNPDDSQIKSALAGNLCRCTGYKQIIDAVKQAATMIEEKDLMKFGVNDGVRK